MIMSQRYAVQTYGVSSDLINNEVVIVLDVGVLAGVTMRVPLSPGSGRPENAIGYSGSRPGARPAGKSAGAAQRSAG